MVRNGALGLLLLFALSPAQRPAKAALYSQDFTHANAQTGLPAGWSLGPPAHVPFFSSSRDSTLFGESAPSVRVDLPLFTLNYRLATPSIQLPGMDRDYTLEFALQIDQPDSPFYVEIVYMDMAGTWHHTERLLTLAGETMSSLRRFRCSFNPGIGPDQGKCWVSFGLSYSKTLRGGCFRLDDVEFREGRETGRLEFYLSPETVAAGEPVDLHISSESGRAAVQVWREEDVSIPVLGPVALDGLHAEPVPDESWRVGCGWPVSYSIPTGGDWPSAVYTVKVDDGDQRVWDTFVIRGKGTEGKLLLILPTHTDQAYNNWRGGCFYSNPQRPEVSFDRPDAHGYWGVFQAPIFLIRWLHRNGIGFGVVDDTDLHFRPELLFAYPGVILCWHSEYWTREMRRNVERFIQSGGSILSFSGNTCWWQTRLVEADDPVEPGECRRLICYKYAADRDPYHDIDATRVTTQWDAAPLNDPPSRFLGLSWRTGGHVNASTSSLCPCEYDWLEGHGGYQAYGTEHWVFEGTGLTDGETFGQQYAIVGYEVDGTPMEWVAGRPVALPDGGTPAGFEILGYAPCWNQYEEDQTGEALMAIRDLGSAFVFNGGTTGWCWGLAGDPIVQRITMNLIRRVPDSAPAFGITTRWEAVPNPSVESVLLRVSGRSLPRCVDFFSIDGRRAASVEVQHVTSTEGTARWDFRDASGRRLPPGVYLARGEHGPSTTLIHVR